MMALVSNFTNLCNTMHPERNNLEYPLVFIHELGTRPAFHNHNIHVSALVYFCNLKYLLLTDLSIDDMACVGIAVDV